MVKQPAVGGIVPLQKMTSFQTEKKGTPLVYKSLSNLYPKAFNVKYVPKVPRENEPNRGKAGRRHLRSTAGRVGTKGTEGLGFSTDAVPPWIAGAPFRVVGHKSKRDRDKVTWGYLDYLILWLGNPIYYKGLYIVIDKQW